jgi:AmpD protein
VDADISPAAGRIDARGFASIARQVPSPNFDDRSDAESAVLIVIHGISLPPGHYGGDSIERLFTNTLDPQAHPYFETIAQLRVSSHFLIRRDGELIQFVSCAKRAWHAGVSSWRGRTACNDFSIGIELEGVDDDEYDDRQYAALPVLTQMLVERYAIESVVGHEHIAPGRKTDPGPAFDWSRFESSTAVPAHLFDDRLNGAHA